MLLFLLSLLGQGCQPLLLLLNLKLSHGQMLLLAATFPSFNIGIPRFLHIPVEVILKNAVGFLEDWFHLLGPQWLSGGFVQDRFGGPLLAHTDLHNGILHLSHQGLIFAAFGPKDLLFYHWDIHHMEVVVVDILT